MGQSVFHDDPLRRSFCAGKGCSVCFVVTRYRYLDQQGWGGPPRKHVGKPPNEPGMDVAGVATHTVLQHANTVNHHIRTGQYLCQFGIGKPDHRHLASGVA